MNHLLSDNTWGCDIELFAVAAMLNVDVWTYYDQRWTCYRPRFKVQDGDIIREFVLLSFWLFSTLLSITIIKQSPISFLQKKSFIKY